MAARSRMRGGLAALAVLLFVSVAGCSSSSEHKAKPRAAATTTTATPTPSPTPTPLPAPTVWPLTGVQTTAVANRPALAVKIENSVDARPQTGLNSADLVWEEVVEGGITRYVAVYQSRIPAQVGPVRSVRPMDPAIAAPLKGVLAYSGGARRFLDLVRRSGVQALSSDGGSAGFFRSGSRPAPHNLYATPQRLIAQADAHHRASPPKQFAFALPGQLSSAAIAGSPASALSLTLSPISHPRWTWDAAHGRYLRSEGGNPAMTADAGRIAATNVVVLRVRIVVLDAVDAAGTHVPETVLSGSGAALVASAGRAVAATWSKGAVGAPMSLVGRDGRPVTLAPGNTWVELVPNGSGAVAVG